MKKLTLSLKSVVTSRAEVGSQLVTAGDAVLIQRGQPRWLLLRCPCGCGEDIPMNLDRRAGKAWRLYISSQRRLTLFPSVWRDTGCQSHFILWRDQIFQLGGWEEDFSQPTVHVDLPDLARRVKENWPNQGWVSYVDVADLLGEIPWDALDACRYLVRSGELIEGSGEMRTQFRPAFGVS